MSTRVTYVFELKPGTLLAIHKKWQKEVPAIRTANKLNGVHNFRVAIVVNLEAQPKLDLNFSADTESLLKTSFTLRGNGQFYFSLTFLCQNRLGTGLPDALHSSVTVLAFLAVIWPF